MTEEIQEFRKHNDKILGDIQELCRRLDGATRMQRAKAEDIQNQRHLDREERTQALALAAALALQLRWKVEVWSFPKGEEEENRRALAIEMPGGSWMDWNLDKSEREWFYPFPACNVKQKEPERLDQSVAIRKYLDEVLADYPNLVNSATDLRDGDFVETFDTRTQERIFFVVERAKFLGCPLPSLVLREYPLSGGKICSTRYLDQPEVEWKKSSNPSL